MVAKKRKMPILSTTGLSFCWPLLADFLLQRLNGDSGLLGSEFGTDENRPERNDDEDRPCTNGEINGTDAHAREAVALHEAGKLACLLDGAGQRQDAAAGHADHHNREHVLAAAVARCYHRRAASSGLTMAYTTMGLAMKLVSRTAMRI